MFTKNEVIRYSWLSRRRSMCRDKVKHDWLFWLCAVLVGVLLLLILSGSSEPETELHRNFRKLATRTSLLEKKVEFLESHLVAYRADVRYGRLRFSRARERHLNRVEQRLRSARFVEKYDYLTNDKYKHFPEQEGVDTYDRRYGND